MTAFSALKSFIKKWIPFRSVSGSELSLTVSHLRFNQGLLLNQSKMTASTLPESEYGVFSQWGEDGIIQFLIRKIGGVKSKKFVEFGVETFTEANCRFLMMKDLWQGLVIDGSKENVEHIRRDPATWRHGLKAKQAFITAENINSIITEAGFSGQIGILSVDIDGNDYWVLKAIDCVEADILILEYNSIFGPDASVTIPYDPEFKRSNKHFSNLYWGASLAALSDLASSKGYFLVGCNSHGNNAFFLNKRHDGKLPPVTVTDAYRTACFRESRNPDGTLSFLDLKDALGLIEGLPLVTVNKNSSN